LLEVQGQATLKKLLPQILIALVALGGYLAADRLNAPIRILPVTYEVNPKISTNLDMVQRASVLFIGDHHAKRLNKYRSQFKNIIVPANVQNLRIINIAEENEGIHRTFRKLKKFNRLPKVIVYMGGTREFYEKKFRLKDRRAIYNNFSVYTNTLKVSAILLFPYLSKFLYQPTKYYVLPEEPIEDEQLYNGLQSQVRSELAFKFFQLEFGEMVKYINEKGSSLIVITAPLKRDTKPNLVCDNTKSEQIDLFQNKMENLIELNKYIEAIPLLKELTEKTVANSRSFYLYGQALMKAGKIKEAKTAFSKSHSFDCNPVNGHLAFNSIIQATYNQNNNFKLFNFDQQLNNQFGKDAVFYSDIYPQDIYYQNLVDDLAKYTKNILNL
jgi:tetratricopeptide (TPR) repeat protein